MKKGLLTTNERDGSWWLMLDQFAGRFDDPGFDIIIKEQ